MGGPSVELWCEGCTIEPFVQPNGIHHVQGLLRIRVPGAGTLLQHLPSAGPVRRSHSLGFVTVWHSPGVQLAVLAHAMRPLEESDQHGAALARSSAVPFASHVWL